MPHHHPLRKPRLHEHVRKVSHLHPCMRPSKVAAAPALPALVVCCCQAAQGKEQQPAQATAQAAPANLLTRKMRSYMCIQLHLPSPSPLPPSCPKPGPLTKLSYSGLPAIQVAVHPVGRGAFTAEPLGHALQVQEIHNRHGVVRRV